jgi:L-alanine-DL-glutamate epimerase-like enolase superfamily enzyme
MRITDIQSYEILPPYHDYNATALFRYHGLGLQLRTIYIVKTDIGLEGYGESGGPLREERFEKYIGTDPFDWIADTQNLPINMAVYDLMGKYLRLPAWKLLGQKVRSWVPVAAWTVSRPPEAMAEEVLSVSRRGYHWMKYHVDVLQNAVDQTEAMQQVAPRGFKIHYDFNEDSNFEAVYPVLRELERFPIAGRIEDPIRSIDQDGYRLLREKCSIPILIHHGPSDVFMAHHLCDGFMAGHASVGQALKLAAMAESMNTPFMLQQSGGTINQAFLAHEAAVFHMASLDHVNLCHLWQDDVTVERMPVVGGSVEVPNGPGLGITLDLEKLETYSRAPRPQQTRFLVRVRYTNGPSIYFRFDPDAPGANVRFLNPPGFGKRYSGYGADVPGPVPGYGNPVVTDFWDETGSEEFEKMWRRTESGPVWTGNNEGD